MKDLEGVRYLVSYDLANGAAFDEDGKPLAVRFGDLPTSPTDLDGGNYATVDGQLVKILDCEIFYSLLTFWAVVSPAICDAAGGLA